MITHILILASGFRWAKTRKMLVNLKVLRTSTMVKVSILEKDTSAKEPKIRTYTLQTSSHMTTLRRCCSTGLCFIHEAALLDLSVEVRLLTELRLFHYILSPYISGT